MMGPVLLCSHRLRGTLRHIRWTQMDTDGQTDSITGFISYCFDSYDRKILSPGV